MTTLLIADDHPLFREALRGAVQRVMPGVELFEADNVDALYTLADAQPDADLLLMDLNMPGAQGFSALVHMRSLHPQLPVVVVSAREEPTVMRRAIDHGAFGFIPKSADSDTIGRALATVLEEHGMDIVWSDNGRDAISRVGSDPQIKVVLMDIMMPEMDGMATMKEIRKLPAGKNLPMIAVTAKAMKGDREKCIDAGAWDYLSKPVNTQDLLAVLRAWLHQ